MALTIVGAGTTASGAFSANVLTAEAATVSANSVSANKLMKRTEFVCILHRLAGSPEVPYTYVFKDVLRGKSYTNAIMWAYKYGIVSGYKGGILGVNDPITIEQAAQILFNHAKFSHRDTSFIRNIAYKYKKSDWADKSHAVDWAVTHKILKPADTSYTYDVTEPASEALSYEMINRYIVMK